MIYFVGSLKTSAHPFSIFVVGEYVSQDDKKFVLRNVARVMEMPNPQGMMGLNFITDHFFTSDSNADVERESIWVSRLLDPNEDKFIVKQLDDFYTGVRAKKTGIALPKLSASTLINQDGRPLK